jgi:hypothetical protein
MRSPERAGFAVLLASAFAACTPAPAKSFDISALKPTVEADQQTLTGWFQMGDGFREIRLYPEQRHLGETGKGACISGMGLSLAGVPTPDLNGKLMTVIGSVHRAGSAEVGTTADTCGSGLIILAMDISAPE